jgi:methionine-rich copper-binding protein CopC
MRQVVLAALAFIPGMTGTALAHAFLDKAAPPVGSTVHGAPPEVVLDFSAALEPSFSSVVVTNAAGTRVDRNDAHAAPNDVKRFVVDLAPLPPGVYRVTWHATSTDTHKTEGSFTFTIAP